MTGSDLRDARLHRRWSQRELARRAGLTHKSVQYWERAAALDPFAHAVKRMAEALRWRISRLSTRARHGVLPADDRDELSDVALAFLPRNLALRVVYRRVTCGAQTRTGAPCGAKSEPGRRRCKLHGGLSTGPRTTEGRQRISEAQRKRWRDRHYA